jgi:hypothetical protein
MAGLGPVIQRSAIEALMKIAAYILGTVNSLIWIFFTWFGSYFLVTVHQENGYQPTILNITTAIILPAIALGLAVWAVWFRRRTESFFVVNFFVFAATVVAALPFLVQFATGV